MKDHRHFLSANPVAAMLLTCLSTSVIFGSIFRVSSAEREIEVTETRRQSNEWGCYYNLPNKYRVMQEAFNKAYEQYLKDPEKQTQCRRNYAKFTRWFVSSQNPNHYILSYHCRTEKIKGFEHLKVEMSGDKFVKILDFQKALKGYGIEDAGDYERKLNEKLGKQILNSLLPSLYAQLKEQKNPFNKKKDLCPDPSDKTFVNAWTKNENGLRYYMFTISCNINNRHGYEADFKTTIEVAFDEYFKTLNYGNPVLVAMASPEKDFKEP